MCCAVCCIVLLWVALYCSVLQCVAVYCSVLQCVTSMRADAYDCTLCYTVLQCVAVCCSVLQCVAVCCSVLQCVTSARTGAHNFTRLSSSLGSCVYWGRGGGRGVCESRQWYLHLDAFVCMHFKMMYDLHVSYIDASRISSGKWYRFIRVYIHTQICVYIVEGLPALCGKYTALLQKILALV